MEKARRLIDLVTISVLMDAGAGSVWTYVTADGGTYKASEGLAMASLDLFNDGFFSSDPAMKTRVNSFALKHVSEERPARGLQVSRQNALVGLAGRAQLLRQLGQALESQPEIFGKELARPGHLADYLMTMSDGKQVRLEHLWKVCSEGFGGIWPKQANGFLQGDVWTHSKLQVSGKPGSDLVPFHKLTQWLVYSLVEALQMTLGIEGCGMEALTGLPEYRNGGLLIDMGLLQLKDVSWLSQTLNVGTELIVEWRALTIVFLDRIADALRQRLGLSKEQLPLTAVLQGGTWSAGRAVAKRLRPEGSPPIHIRSDGTVF